jgi:hypothetical protein
VAIQNQRVGNLRDSFGQYLTVDLVYDDITFLVSSVKVINAWQVSFTYTTTDSLGVAVSKTVTAGQTDTSLLAGTALTLASTLEFPNGWKFGGA